MVYIHKYIHSRVPEMKLKYQVTKHFVKHMHKEDMEKKPWEKPLRKPTMHHLETADKKAVSTCSIVHQYRMWESETALKTSLSFTVCLGSESQE